MRESDEPSTLEDAMERYSNGDATALPCLYDRIAPRVRDYARRRLATAAVEIVVEEVMLSIHKHRGDYVPGAPVMPWAFSFARAAVEIVVAAQGERDPEDDATFSRHSRDQLKRLPEPMRSALELVWLEGFTPQQAADLLGTGTRIVRAWTGRAFRMLEELHDEADETAENDYDAGGSRGRTGTEAAPELAGVVVCGTYRVGAELGHGGMATVYEATELASNRNVAMKVLADGRDPIDVERFGLEFKALRALRGHPRIVEVFEEGDLPDGRCFYTMERLHGETLKDLLRAEVRLDWRRTAEIVRQICEALSAVHEKDLVHRDIKPGNVFLLANEDKRIELKLIDFGIAQKARFETGVGQLTRPGTMPGTFAYTAPERAQSQTTHARCDVYSLGITMFELLAGRRPFWTHAGDVYELAASLTQPPPTLRTVCPIADCTDEIEAIVHRAIEREPEHRFQSVEELSAAIAALDRDGHGRLPFMPRPRAAGREHARTVFVGGSAILTIGSIVYAALIPEPPPQDHVGEELREEHIQPVLDHVEALCRRHDEDAPTMPVHLKFKVQGSSGRVNVADPVDTPERARCLEEEIAKQRFPRFDKREQLIERDL